MTRAVIPTFIAAVLVLTTSAFAARYDDFAAWAQRDKASSHQLLIELAHARSAHDIALALRASADRQHKITSQLIAVVQRHPELRCMAELGLDEDAFRRWSEKHSDADKRRSALPPEVFRIATDMQDYTASLEKAPEAAARHANIEKYRHDPEVVAATEQLGRVLADNEQRLMKAFDQ